MDLPVYRLFIDAGDDSGVDYVALVDRPAIERNFMAFNEIKPVEFLKSDLAKPLHFSVVNEDRHIISGPAMLADAPIYRNDEQRGEYFVMFDAPSIFQIVEKFFEKNFNKNFNLMHNPKEKIAGVSVFESFIVDKSRGIQPMKGFEDAKDGSWFLSAKVNNPEVWKMIKEGIVKGFSVEGIFSYKPVAPSVPQSKEEDILKQIAQLLKNIPA